MLVEEQIAERRLRARKEGFRIEAQGRTLFGDYQVFSPTSKRTYRVALRGVGLFDNYCACPDYAVNTLGTCKHIEAVLLHARSRFGGKVEKNRYRRNHSTIYLDYREKPRVRIASPAKISTELLALREEFFDSAGFLKPQQMALVAEALARLRSIDEKVVIYGDALEWIERETATAEGLAIEANDLRLLEQGKLPLDNLLKVPLYPFQMRGVLFAVSRGRTILADDMGLGKTIQAIGAAEMLARRRGIRRVLVICPASVKHQWLTEIKRFSDRSAVVIDGSPEQRRALYKSEAFFKIVNYELERQGWLSPVDQQRLLCAIQNLRMICDSTFLFDKETEVSPKLEELKEIIHELVVEEERKVVIFSEWEKMTQQVGALLDKMKIGYVSLHGGIPTRRRGQLIAKFRDNPDLKVFLSTDAGGVGINLQAASAVINVEPPWNPARLEQRIARVHRMGQVRPVLAIHLLTENSIEERVWETIRLKKELFNDLFDGAGSEVSFEKLGRRSMIETLKEIAPDSDSPVFAPEIQKTDGKSNGLDGRDVAAPAPSNGADGTGQALAMLLEAGIKFIETLSQSGRGESAEKPSDVAPSAENQSRSSDAAFGRIARNIEAAISPLIKKEPGTDKAALHIPLPVSLTSARIAQTITAALSRLMAG